MNWTIPSDIPNLPPRDVDSHKGTFGRAMLIGGSPGFAGSISLSGRACLRGGAGLVTVAVPNSIAATVAGFDPAFMTMPLETDRRGSLAYHAMLELRSKLPEFDVLSVGPGLGTSRGAYFVVDELFETFEGTLIVDADGLNLLSKREFPLAPTDKKRIVTPHLGEFRRLAKNETLTMREARALAEKIAVVSKVVIVLKGKQTLVTDGENTWLNPSGNPGLATGGTGDVLTGLITALAAQQLSPYNAAVLGVFLHGLAADIAVKQITDVSLTATELVDYLSAAFAAYQNR